MPNQTGEVIEIEQRLLGDVWTSPALWESVRYLCDECNGRFAGTDDERRAGDFLLERFRELGAENVTAEPFEMKGWQRGDAQLTLLAGDAPRDLPCLALPGSPAGQAEAEIIAVRQGTAEDFERLGGSVAGKIVLADDGGPHRLEKYARAQLAKAEGFVFANARPGMLALTGSLSMGEERVFLPGVGISLEAASLLRRQGGDGPARVRITVGGETQLVQARNILAELPGSDPDAGWIIVCGHYDGHDVAQGAQDNATGTAVVLEVARVLAPLRSHLKAGLRFVLFSGEEMGLWGSHAYARDHADELDQIRAVFNADIVGLAAPLTLTVQNHPELTTHLRRFPLEDLGAKVEDTKVMAHSDHFPFALAGVPAIAVMTSRPESGGGMWVHTQADTLDKLDQTKLREAAATSARILLRMAMNPDDLPRGRQTAEEVEQAIAKTGEEGALRIQGEWPF
jgi:hypothetical protein